MKLQSNTFYITRGGKKAYIYGINPFCDEEGTDWVGVVDGVGEECWTVEGKYFTGSASSPLDIIEEWNQ